MKTLCRFLFSGIFVLLILVMHTAAVAQQTGGTPTVQDCLGAIPVCQPVYSTTASYTGHGNVYPEIRNNSACPLCMDGEKNDVFYVITVQTGGVLRFKLTPNNPQNDYDWSLFNMTSAGCDQIYTNASTLQVSCNSYGITGNNGPTGINSFLGNNLNCNGPGNLNGPAFNKDLQVLAGQTYVLNISNWSATNQSGYTLDFSGSTATIFDNVPPVIDSIQEQISCAGTTSLYFRFSENVRCDEVFHHAEKFTLTGPSGPIVLADIGSVECATGATNGRGFSLVTAAPLGAGSYTLNVAGDIHDLCDNLALYNGYPFQLTEINAPTAMAGNDTTIANGAVITLHGNASGGAAPYTFHWEPAALLVDPNVQQPVTIGMGASAQFSVTVTDHAGCHGLDEVLVTVVGGVLGVNGSATPAMVCPGAPVVLMAVASGGSGNYTYNWSSSPPGFTSGLQSPTVYPLVTTTYTVAVNDGFSTASFPVTVTVNPSPVANPGPPTSIPYGTNTTLSGSASGGSGSYTYYWTSNPPGFSSTLASPLVVNLMATTIFTLTVTDAVTGCVSAPADVIISVTGSPLACNPVASPATICSGASTSLFAMAGGGAGSYTYSWSSTPPGFSSTEANPEVSPTESTSYILTISDGFNLATGIAHVHVNPSPVINLGSSDTLVCIYSTVTLDAGNPDASWYWSNGSTSRTIEVNSAGIGYDEQQYTVRVINSFACVDSASIRVVFSFAACTSLDEEISGGHLKLSPNPGHGRLNLSIEGELEPFTVTITTMAGEVVFREDNITSDAGPVTRSWDLSSFPKGLYLVSLRNSEIFRVVKFINN